MDFDLLLRVYVWIASIVGTLALCAGFCALCLYGIVRFLVRRAAAKSMDTLVKIAALKAQMATTPDEDKAVH